MATVHAGSSQWSWCLLDKLPWPLAQWPRQFVIGHCAMTNCSLQPCCCCVLCLSYNRPEKAGPLWRLLCASAVLYS
jgi:hypothetical protein